MAGLRSLLDYTTVAGGGLNYNTLRVWKTNINDAENGGSCCLWTVPTGTKWFAIEVWGGGGGGAGACSCGAGWPGGSGSYARKIITGLSGGEEFTVCAAGSNCCCCSTGGNAGYPSFVACNGGSVVACASGGQAGNWRCRFHIGCSYSGCQQEECGSWVGSFGINGVSGGAKGSAFCTGVSYQFMPSAPFTFGGARGTRDGCSGRCCGYRNGGYAHFPGGGGATAVSHGDNRSCGQHGAGGMVVIYYGQPV
jgi:hypothetical protein